MCWLRGSGISFRAHSQMWVHSSTPSNPPTAARGPAVQVASDTIYSETASHALGSGLCQLQSQSRCYLCSCPNSYNSEVSTTLSLGLINLLEWLRELRKIFYLPTRFHPDGRAAWGGVGEELRAHHSPGHDRLHQLGCLLRPLVLGFYGGFLTEASLVKPPGNRVNLQPLLPPGSVGGGTEISSPPITGLFPLATSPILSWFPKTTSLR